jgi:DNA-binding response OmpR family regulator
VTDNPLVSTFMTTSLVKNNYRVLNAHSGEEALTEMNADNSEIHHMVNLALCGHIQNSNPV